jgi:hypothetical protein
MKKKRVYLAVILIVAVVSSSGLFAAALDKSLIPADTKWVIHFDMELFNRTTLKEMMMQKLDIFKLRKLEKKVYEKAKIELFKDVKSITAFSKKEREKDVVFCLKGNFDREYFVELMKKAHDYSESKYGNFTLHHFGHTAGVFPGKNICLYSGREETVKEVLDVMQGKQKNITSSGLMTYLRMIPANAFLLAAANDVSALDGPRRAGVLLNKTGMASFMAQEKNKDLSMKVMLNTDSPETSEKVENVIRGLMAFADLQTHAKEEHPALFKLIDAVKVTRKGNTVQLDFSYPSTALVEMLAQKYKRHSYGH